MKRNQFLVLLPLACSIVTLSATAQDEYPQPGRMNPDMTEFWTPQPAIVTPGDITTQSAPSDAIVLFDGKDLSAWETPDGKPAPWTVADGMFAVKPGTGTIQTKQKFESYQLHIEWSEPKDIQGESQGRGNSGVFMQGMYEVQILDSYDNKTYANGQAGSIYKQHAPLVNAMRAPGEWNVYDIIYSAPIFKEDGTFRVPPTITVIHNGVVVQNHVTILGTTEYIGLPRQVKHGAGSIQLQDHGNPVRFRNVWIREL